MLGKQNKYRPLLTTAIVFFTAINTLQLWEGNLGIAAFPFMFVLFLVYLALIVLLIAQIVFAIKEKGRDRKRLWVMGWVALVLGLTTWKPAGLVNWDALAGKDLLVAELEGTANCMTTLKLKKGNRFTEHTVCFGVDEISGRYTLKNDTIFFVYEGTSRRSNPHYEFALIRRPKTVSETPSYLLCRYKNKADTIGHFLWIRKNELLK